MSRKEKLALFLANIFSWIMLSIVWMIVVGVVLFLITLVTEAIAFNWLFVFLSGLIGGGIQVWKESQQ